MKYDVVVIGSGPAGLTAGLYAARAKHSTLVLEGLQAGGQLTTTTYVENWPGNKSILGFDLMDNIKAHAQEYGAIVQAGQVTAVDFSQYPYTLTIDNNQNIEAKSVIIATGSSHKKLGCPGEQEYFAKGVATCATCDAPFYSGKNVVIVGGGNTAVTEAEHLSKFAKTVTIIHILEELTATDPIKFKVLAAQNINFIYSSTVQEIKGNGEHVTKVVIRNQKTGVDSTLATDGVFIAIGFYPNTKLFQNQLAIDAYGYLKLEGHTQTSKQGVFAAGDVADYKYRQAITSAGMGCMAALDAQSFLAQQPE